ncbi:MAG: DeoR/GlpR family DNA-binding transcription regulator [bacterium]|nr:DeoR/GlpR family DNA-binding transcription regulator [bacterium]
MSTVSVTEQRRARLCELIRTEGFVSIPDLRMALEVSESTVRRDLDYLEAEGEVRRTHGGVFFTGNAASMRHFQDRRDAEWERKRQVAIAASELIEDHDTLLIDGGSTAYELARQLLGRPLQVVTNSLPVANLFASSDAVDLVLLGGYVHHRTSVSLGPYANQMLSTLNVQKAVLSIAGADHRGYYNSNLLLVETERAMMQSADQTIVVADSSKFGRSSLAKLCGLSEVETVVSDESLSSQAREWLEEAGVCLLLAADRRSGSASESNDSAADQAAPDQRAASSNGDTRTPK